MPLYRLQPFAKDAPPSPSAPTSRRRSCACIAASTGAAPPFVHAFFQERPESELPPGKAAFMLGSIRWGRTDEQKAEIVADLTRALAETLGCGEAEVGVITADVPSRWNMEGGELLPEPGEEAAWLARHR